MFSCLSVLCRCGMCFLFFKKETAYDMRISDWSSDVCSSDLMASVFRRPREPYLYRSWNRIARGAGRKSAGPAADRGGVEPYRERIGLLREPVLLGAAFV